MFRCVISFIKTGNRSIHRQTNSRSVKSQTGQLADSSTRQNVWFKIWSI